MAKENEIVASINAGVKAVLKDKRFNGSQFCGITTLLSKGGDPLPCEIDDQGEATWIAIDDNRPVQIYHRNNGSMFSVDDSNQFGDGINRKQPTSMSMFVIAQRKAIKMPVEDLVVLVASGIPVELPKEKRADLNLKLCNINLQSVDVKAISIFKREQNNQKILDPQVIMFELKYQIECGYGNACINTLCC